MPIPTPMPMGTAQNTTANQWVEATLDRMTAPQPTGQPMKLFMRYWMPPIVLCAAIFLQSCFATPHVLPGWPFQDKMLHAGVYGLLGALWARVLNTLKPRRARTWPLLVAATAMATLYGLSDEWHQSFVTARSAEGADLLADFIGSAMGSWIYVRIDKSTNFL